MRFTLSGSTGLPPVLLLHGGGVAGWMWDFLRERLEPNHAVLVPDLSGQPFTDLTLLALSVSAPLAAVGKNDV